MRTVLVLLLGGLLAQAAPQAAPDDPASAEFFEKNIRPVLVERCYSCHSATAAKLKGGLRVDSREHLLKGGDTGPALVPGHPEKSLFVEVVSYKNVDLKMPPKSKLPANQIADLTEWVRKGAPWPGGEATHAAAKKEQF